MVCSLYGISSEYNWLFLISFVSTDEIGGHILLALPFDFAKTVFLCVIKTRRFANVSVFFIKSVFNYQSIIQRRGDKNGFELWYRTDFIMFHKKPKKVANLSQFYCRNLCRRRANAKSTL